ncbi:tetratricopeptide repeat protein [Nitzschia inconspicua]|uniref:Tetratricopeptide repeat protein n=1 Tax=Nitzschia inconspicua TaxID=303405 RepID=A0A9K3PWS9_9STRA|nr:tetratricopeptide repeat protein [Nitzschia inconspicua]KAG7362682.1 tetratricopeptide repeat protein [Nitzschia inconspicua]
MGDRKSRLSVGSALAGSGRLPPQRHPKGGISYPSATTTITTSNTLSSSSFGTSSRNNAAVVSSTAPLVMARSPSDASTATTVSMRSQQGFTDSTSSNVFATSHLPPKSPASMNNRILLTVGSTGSSSSNRSRGSGASSRGRNKGGSRRGRSRSSSRSRRRSSSRNSRKSYDTAASDSDDNEADQLPDAPANAGSVTVDTDSDDLSNAEDFSLISFNTKSCTEASSDTSPTSVITKGQDPFTGVVEQGHNVHRRTHHRRNRSWDSLGSCDSSMAATSSSSVGTGSKSCLALPKILQRHRQRVQVADVASVGNASDTLVPAENGRITGRELHEAAKARLNDGDYEQALNMFSAILNAQIERFGSEQHSSVGAALHNVGVVRLRMGDHEIAEDVLLRATVIRRNVLGAQHLDLAATLAKLGSAKTALMKFDEGLQALREALQITRHALGRNHRAVAQILCHIACLYFEADEMFSAQATFEDALEIYRAVFQLDADRDACTAQMTETLCNIGTIQNKRKNFSGAIESFREALDLQRGITGHDHPRVIASLDNLGYSFSKSKSYNQALACYREMLNAQVSHYGSFTIECCDTLKKQVLIYGKLKNASAAEKVVSSFLEQVKSKNESSVGDPVVFELEQMLKDLKCAKRSSKNKTKGKKGPRDRSLDCFDRILFDKRRQAEF